MNNNPCEQCIVLAICKAKFNEIEWKGNRLPNIVDFVSIIGCELIRDYLNTPNFPIDNLRATFGLEPIEREIKRWKR